MKSVTLPVLCKNFLRRALLCDDWMRSTAHGAFERRPASVRDPHQAANFGFHRSGNSARGAARAGPCRNELGEVPGLDARGRFLRASGKACA